MAAASHSTGSAAEKQGLMLMRVTSARVVPAVAMLIGCIVAAAPQTDLDAFMRQVVARRDDNWKKLQQYVLDEREAVELRGPNRLTIWGERRDYTWFIRDGFFVRSPVKVNGATVGESDRRKAEAEYLKRQQERESRGQRGMIGLGSSGLVIEPPEEAPTDVDGLLTQTRQPGFVSSAYFLRFKFEEGKYALVGRETLDGRDVMRVEYYPTKLFGGTDRRRDPKRGTSEKDRAYDAAMQRLMNKVSLVTLWVEPNDQQIVKYTFNNLPVDFLPGSWLMHLDDLKASMTMSQPFPDVWLPRDLEFLFGMSMAFGKVDMRYDVEYHDYRRADVAATIKVK